MNTNPPFNRHGERSSRESDDRLIRSVLLASCLLTFCLLSSLALAKERADAHMERTPSAQHMAPALRAYRHGNYGVALRRFERAAFWADKLAQYNIGVIHYLGQGVEPDPARAWAWFELAAERDYPVMETYSAQVWDELDAAQRERAQQILRDELTPLYGDSTAIERTRRHMRRDFRRATGSRLGRTSTRLTVFEVKGPAIYNPWTGELYANGKRFSGPEFYRPDLWNFDQVLANEEWFFNEERRGSILLRDLEVNEAEPEPEQP
jgi:hypothetical protein